MKKGILTILLCGVIVLGLTGCNTNNEQKEDNKKEEKSTMSMNLKIKRYENYDTIKFYPYYTKDERVIYFAGDIEEFYVFGDENINLKDYITDSDQTLDNSINSIIEKIDKIYELDDGGTAIYKSKDLDLTITVCNTLDNNRDIYFDNYNSNFDKTMCK